MRQLVYTMFITNNHNSFHLLWHENFVKHQNVSKYYGQDCRLRVGFSHLKEQEFRHNFVDAIKPLCSCRNFVESTSHFFLHCTHFSNQRLAFINKIKDIDKCIFDKNDSLITHTRLFGDEKISMTDKKSIVEAIIQF